MENVNGFDWRTNAGSVVVYGSEEPINDNIGRENVNEKL